MRVVRYLEVVRYSEGLLWEAPTVYEVIKLIVYSHLSTRVNDPIKIYSISKLNGQNNVLKAIQLGKLKEKLTFGKITVN